MCGIAGYTSRSGANATTQVMIQLYAQQHRGQESGGIVVSSGEALRSHKTMGYIKEGFTPDILDRMEGPMAIGHVRYPTRGTSNLDMTQPYVIETLSGPAYAIASNGDIVNYEAIANELRVHGVHFNSKNDGELLGRFIVFYHERRNLSVLEAIKLLMKRVKGAYSALFMTRDCLYVFRDRQGFRPLNIGIAEDGDIAVASESCAIDLMRCEDYREVEPGEIVVITPTTHYSVRESGDLALGEPEPPRHHCVFELIYFARPDSAQFNEYVYEVRHKIGARLAAYDDFDADVAVPVPDSANFIAMGYARAKNIPYAMALIRNHYVGRTFIRPDQNTRDEGVRQKFNPLRDFFDGKKVVLVDDSIVRGTTIRKLVRMVKGAGAAEVHLRIGSPPVTHSCYYGIDTPDPATLIANRMSLDAIREHLCADSLKYLHVDDLRECVKTPRQFCYACFTGNYPLPREDSSGGTTC